MVEAPAFRRGEYVTVNHLDAQVGGSFEFETKALDNARTLTTGTYLEVSFSGKLVFTWVSSANLRTCYALSKFGF